MHFATDVTAKKQSKFKNLGAEYLAANQGVVGSNPAGRATNSYYKSGGCGETVATSLLLLRGFA